ncbi:MAG: chemotaxis protein [Paenibacillus sp.]|nr:chemotaxis protein [Paenibacillus sp.]
MQAFETIMQVTDMTASGTQSVSAATEEQLATMEEIASSANLLSSMAEELQTAIGRFKV